MIDNSLYLPTLKGQGGCFGAGVVVEMQDGFKPIEQVQVGEIVASFNDKGEVSYRKVTAVFAHDEHDLYKFTLWGGKTLDVTLNHWVLNQYNTFACIGSLTEQDMLVDARGHLVPLVNREYIGKATVYNLHVDGNCTFIANGIRVHNGGIDTLTLRGSKGKGGGGGASFTEAPNTAQSATTAKLLEAISCGEIVGLVDGAKSIYLDQTPLQNADGSYNFKGVTWQTRNGTPDQDVIKGFENLNTEVAVSVDVTKNQPVVRTIQTTDVKGITIKIGLPSGLSLLDTGANSLVGSRVELEIYISYDGTPYKKLGNVVIEEKIMSPYERGYYFPIQASDEINLKIVRVTEDSTNSNLQNKTEFNGYTLHSGYSLNYPHTALIGFTVNAKEFGSNLPNRFLKVRGLIMEVPSNYDPVNRIYSGIWDGTFKRAYTNNPAWFLWWILTDKINGVGGDIPKWAISQSKWDLYEIAKRCDELVDDGRGGKEPRFTFNAWITDRKKVFEYLSLICGTCSSLCYWSNNSIGFSQDRPQDIERVFNNSNVIDGKFCYSQTSLQSQHTVAKVAWHNPENFCKATYEVVEDVDGIYKHGIVELDMALLGCTSRGQAHRAGAFALYSEKYENKTVAFKVSLENATIRIGEIIGISDSQYQGINYSGRVRRVDKKTVYLDRSIDFNAGIDYQIIITLADGTAQKVGVVNPLETTNAIEITEELRNSVINGAVFAIVSTELVPQEYRVLDIQEEEETVFSVFAVKYDKRKYDYIEKGYALPPDEPETIIPTGKLKAPINLTIEEYLYKQSNGSILSACLFSWQQPNDPRVKYYEVRYLAPNDTVYNNLGFTSSLSVDIKDLKTGWHTFEVRSVSDMGLKSDWSVIKYKVLGLELPLPDVTGLTTVYKDNRINLVWDEVQDVRPFVYQIRKGLSWRSAMIIAETKNRFLPLTSNGVYQVKAVFQKAESVNPAIIEVENVIGDGFTGNVIARIDERADEWDGIYTDFYKMSNGDLLLTTGGSDFYGIADFYAETDIYWNTYTGEEAVYEVNQEKEILLSANNVCNISIDFDGLAFSRKSGFYEVLDFYNNNNFYGVIDGGDWYIKVDIMVRKNGVWGDWQEFYPSDYVGDGFRFRFRAKANKDITLYIKEFKASVDVPDRREYWKNVFIPAEGLQLNFEPPFNGIPAIVATIIQATGNEDVLIDDDLIDKNGAFIRVVDKQGQNVEKYLNIHAQGY